MEETRKKVLQRGRCLICSTAVQKKRKKIIFGKSSFDFPAIFSSCLNVNAPELLFSDQQVVSL